MNTFRFKNPQNTIVVEVETDAISTTQDNLTIQEINYVQGDEAALVGYGFYFQILPTTKAILKAFATAKNLTLDIIDGASGTTTNLVTGTSLAITSTSPITAGTISVAYSEQLTSEGGNGSIVYSIDSGDLPAGVTLSANGLVAGTPTESGTFVVVYAVTDTFGQVATKSLSLTIVAG